MDATRIDHLLDVYRDGLLNDTLPFWLEHALDESRGGYFSALDRDGTVIDTDKAVWIQGRFAWLLATLYVQVEQRPEWLQAARLGIDFLQRHCFDTDGRMFFQVTREGRPLRKRRYVFSEMFAVIALAAYARASGDGASLDGASLDGAIADRARQLLQTTARRLVSGAGLQPKVDPQTRPMLSFSVPMILINTASVLRDMLADDTATQWIDWSIAQIERYFLNDGLQAVLETVGPDGQLIDHYDGRLLNPGHAIEGAWFVLAEAKRRNNDPRLIAVGTKMLDWMWRWGWDEQHGGILYFRDVRGLPVQEYWQDMKFWWPQNEAIIATLLAYQLTGEARYAQWHRLAHDWAYRHFPDPEFGEWYGYLHRDGSPVHRAKGTMWKGPFHLPRMQLICWQILQEIQEENLSRGI
jgi:N-acylglucosamine 2-epimerase